MRLLFVATLLTLSQACVLAVNVRGHHARDHDDPDDSDTLVTDTDVDTDTGRDGLDVRATITPASVEAGTAAIVSGTLTGDATAWDVVGVTLSDGVLVEAWRVLDDGTLVLSIDVPLEAVGWIDLTLDLGDRGAISLPDVLEVVAPNDGADTGPARP